jgi:thiamine biosynthesis lipoprotein ApbE
MTWPIAKGYLRELSESLLSEPGFGSGLISWGGLEEIGLPPDTVDI